MSRDDPGDVTRLLQSWSEGNKDALEQLTPLVYQELRRLAASYMRHERPDHTLQPTGLVHEAWLRLVDQTRVGARTRSQFFAIAANLMRQILVNHARDRNAQKRSGGGKIALEFESASARTHEVDLIALDEALTRLAALDPRQSHVVELRFFGGLTEEAIADVLRVSVITVKRDWRIARAVLYRQLGGTTTPAAT